MCTQTPPNVPPLTREQALELAAGPLGEEMARFPLRFCKPVFFGLPPRRGVPATVMNGTGTLLLSGKQHLILTCDHVISEYERLKAENTEHVFGVGNCSFDPSPQFIARDRALDYAVIKITEAQAAGVIGGSGGIGEAFLSLHEWPTAPARIDEFMTYGGFPAELQRVESEAEINFGTYSSGACRVSDAHGDYIACEFERAYWVQNFGEVEPEKIGGLSGGPVFKIRNQGGLTTYHFMGIIFQYHADPETLFIRSAHAMPNLLNLIAENDESL
jgi:hypothetical protein